MAIRGQAQLALGRTAAEAAGGIIRNYFRSDVSFEHKQTYNLVSAADREAEQVIVEHIRAQFPTHGILGEEGHADRLDAHQVWVIDPLDGTNNFAHGLARFAVSIGYYEAGEPIAAVIYDPIHEDWFTAIRGQGAFHNNRPLRVSVAGRLDQALIGVGFYYDRGPMMSATLAAIEALFHQHIHGIRRFGAASLDLCHVAAGHFEAFFEYELAPWDFAAGRLILEEAGGRMTTTAGEPLGLTSSTVLASNGHLHSAVQEIVSRYWPMTTGRTASPG